MVLRELMKDLRDAEVKGKENSTITGLAYDSRQVTPGSLFVAVRGHRVDGHAFLQEAVTRGAEAVVVETNAASSLRGAALGAATVITVPNSRRALAVLANTFYDYPSRHLGLIGVTGTNGKTTTTYICKAILTSAGQKTGLLGTVAYHLGDHAEKASHTTPESLDLQRLLSGMVRGGMAYGVMEVSSHALTQERVYGCLFDVAVFTSFSRDHLDFHGTLENYFQAKLTLFTTLGRDNGKAFPRRAIINSDSAWGERVVRGTSGERWTFSLDKKDADLRAEDLSLGRDGMSFTAVTPQGRFPVRSRLTGRYNVSNLLAGIGVALSQEVSVEAIQAGIEGLPQVPGRFEKIDEGQDYLAVVDYAHTEDALRRLLIAVGEVVRGRVILVFGCGGDRDRGKRPAMGKVAAALSDAVIITSDNPRSEEPLEIIRQIEKGLEEGLSLSKGRAKGYEIIPDRREAIERALSLAGRGDGVIVAGKGHEVEQIIGEKRLPFDDREVTREAIRKRLSQGKRSC